MPKQSAGILLYKLIDNELQVMLVHPGGPFFAKKDAGSWSIPKGEVEEGEDLLDAAKREFKEELGKEISGTFMPLDPIKQKGGKVVHAWAVEASLDISNFNSNTFTIEWPPKSGKMKEFPEVDKAEWFSIPIAKEKINTAQVAIIDELMTMLKLT